MIGCENIVNLNIGIPVDDTVARIIKKVDSKWMNDVFINLINEIREFNGRELIAIDGKTLCHSFEKDVMSAFHSVTVWNLKGLCCRKNAQLVIKMSKRQYWK